MRRIDAEVAIIGSSFAGSLLALILRRLGIDVVLLDRHRHPRFAIGESSTPAADLILADLCARYDLPRLKPLTRYGRWRESYPEVRCGLKRGFSYFHHRPGRPFEPDERHSNELLVTASAADEISDTHWYRADVDAFFAAEARSAGAALVEEFEIADLARDPGWTIRGVHAGCETEVRARFLFDSSGSGGALPRQLGLPDRTAEMETDSWCVFGHFSGVRRWSDVLRERGGRVENHPFACDAAALHHVIDGGWIWVLPFDGDITSVGMVFDGRRHPRATAVSGEAEWNAVRNQYPSLAEQFDPARLVPPFDALRISGRLQRQWEFPAADDWTLLPGTAGFIDPLYSTGIAHSLVGVERLARAFEERADHVRFQHLMAEHARTTTLELRLIDRLVAASYHTFGRDPGLLASVAMLYFAAATTWERERATASPSTGNAFLLADQPDWTARVELCLAGLSTVLEVGQVDSGSVAEFSRFVAGQIAPYNAVGLFHPEIPNMYRYTAASK